MTLRFESDFSLLGVQIIEDKTEEHHLAFVPHLILLSIRKQV